MLNHPVLTFPVDNATLKPPMESVGSWSRGLVFHLLKDVRQLPSESYYRQRHHAVWSTSLEDIRPHIDPLVFNQWLAEIPAAILEATQKHGLLDFGSLYLLHRHPEMQNRLNNPHLFRYIAHEWLVHVKNHSIEEADDYIKELLSRPLREIYWSAQQKESRLYGRLVIDFLKKLHGKYESPVLLQNLEFLVKHPDFLPYFQSSSARFAYKLKVLEAFLYATIERLYDSCDLAPLFFKTLKRGDRVSRESFSQLLHRIEITSRLLGKPSIHGLLKEAPSIAYLKKYLRRNEKAIEKKLPVLMKDPEALGAEIFPKSGLMNWPNIDPVLNQDRLLLEGSYMKNCIATFSWKIKFKNYFAYAVSFPERCTLLIRKENNEWLIEDIRTWGNKPPSPITIELVESWLSGKDVPNEVLENIPDSFYQRGFAQKSHDSYQYQIFNNDGNYENVGDDTYYDNEDNDDEYLACFSREDACPTNLPGKIDGWVRIYYDDGQFYTEDWKVLPIPAELRHDFLEIFEENFIYIHPKIPLLYAAIEQHGATAESLEFISLENGKISYSNMKGMTKQELLLTSALRQRISYLLNIQTLMEKTHSS